MIQQERAQPLADRCPARLAGDQHARAAAVQLVGEPADVRALARTVDAFERDETAGQFHRAFF